MRPAHPGPDRALRRRQPGLRLAVGQQLLDRRPHVEDRQLGRPVGAHLVAQRLGRLGVDGAVVGHADAVPLGALGASPGPRRTSFATSSGSRSSGSPHPPPPQVTKCRTSPGETGTSWHLLGSTWRVPSARSTHLRAARARVPAVDAPRVGQPAVVVDGDRARLLEDVGDVDAVAAAVQARRRRCRRRSPTSRSAAGSRTPGTRRGCSRSSATASGRPARRRAAGRGCRRSRSSTAGTTPPSARRSE